MFKSRLLGVALVIACCISAVEALKPNDVCKGRQFFSHESCSCDATSSRKLLSMEDKKTIAIEFVRKHMEAASIPGMALSVVVQNETILSMGFGIKESSRILRTIFGIEKLTELFIALAVTESGQVHFKDTVKKHLPWFQLQDKYAEEHTTIQDLLVHNSVFSILDALPFELGVFKSELEYVQALRHLTTYREFRDGHHQSSMNYIVLGQVIEVVTKKSWFQYVKEVILDPLGMSNTYGRPADVANMDQLTSGHFICNGRTIGPFSYLNSTMVELSPSNNYAAAFSMVSSIDDMTKLSQALLHKDKRLFQHERTLGGMLGEHTIKSGTFRSFLAAYGFLNISESTPVVAGLGFDHIGNLVENQPYFGKLGGAYGTAGWLPNQQVGVIVLVNGFNSLGHNIDYNHILALRSYLLRLFMDVRVERLDRDYQAWVNWVEAKFTVVPCHSCYFGGIPCERPGIEITESVKKALVGTYCADSSRDYIGNVTIARDGQDLTLQWSFSPSHSDLKLLLHSNSTLTTMNRLGTMSSIFNSTSPRPLQLFISCSSQLLESYTLSSK
ncbi:hypothetical protein Ae201684P_001267 [Aphanomyces euteiches]|nr:hypothetical protein Ae201684P_001267 [Aphanomyces euteiches]